MISQNRHSRTIAGLADLFLARYAPVNTQDLGRYRRHARSVLYLHVIPVLGRRHAVAIMPGHVELVREGVAARCSASRVVGVLGVLSTMFKWGMRHSLVRSNPCEPVRRPRVVHSTDFYSVDEVRRIRRTIGVRRTQHSRHS